MDYKFKIVDTGVSIAKIALILKLNFILLISLCGFVFEHNADAFKPPGYERNHLASFITRLFSGFHRWDSVYFTFIAQNGYIFDNLSVFFPMFPFTIFIATNYIKYAFNIGFNLSILSIAIGVLINFIMSFLACIQFYKLTFLLFKNERIAFLSALLFIINPATVFFHVMYTESFYVFFTISGLLYNEMDNSFLAFIYFSLACLTRSNGILNIGFLLYPRFISLLISMYNVFQKHFSLNKFISFFFRIVLTFVSKFIPMTLCIIFVASPLFIYQGYIYGLFCDFSKIPPRAHILIPRTPDDSYYIFAQTSGLTMPLYLQLKNPVKAAWCKSQIPLPYFEVQKKYWNLGMFNYFEWKQLPNFILATPVLVLTVLTIWSFYRRAPSAYKTLGLRSETHLDQRLIPYIFHLMFLSGQGFINMHVQVLTRLLFSSCPILYWYCAILLYRQNSVLRILDETSTALEERHKNQLKFTEKLKNGKTDVQMEHENLPWCLLNAMNPLMYRNFSHKFLVMYFWLYAILGCILHPMFLPWT